MYTLCVYNKNEDMFEEFKHFSKMQRAKDFVDNERETGSLKCACYIMTNNKILKRYSEIQ